MASAIASKAIEASTDDAEATELYANMDIAAMDALAAFPGALSAKELNLVAGKLSLFCDEMGWDHKHLHIHNFLIFSTEQLECVRSELIAHNADNRKVKAIERLIATEVDIYERFSDLGEYPECAIEGMKAANIWSQIWS
jgi:hypothetical protein